MNEWVQFIREVGFPIAVAAFVLVKLNGKVDKLTEAIVTLTTKIEVLIARDGDGHR